MNKHVLRIPPINIAGTDSITLQNSLADMYEKITKQEVINLNEMLLTLVLPCGCEYHVCMSNLIPEDVSCFHGTRFMNWY